MNRRNMLVALLSPLFACSVAAQPASYPAKPVRVVVGFAPGGAADYVARSMSEAFAKALGQPVIVDNKPGNGSSIAAELVAKAPPDGYTLLIASPISISVNPALNPKLGYTPTDLAPVTKMTTSPLVLAVNPATGIRSVADLIAAAKKDPNKLNYASSGNGSAPHLGAALFSQLTGVQMTHVPYRGGAPAIQSVIAGDTQLTFGTTPSVLPQASGGRLIVIAVSTRERSPLVPDLPGMREAGLPEYNLEFWYGMFAPAGTPPAVIRKIYDATISAMQQPSVKAASDVAPRCLRHPLQIVGRDRKHRKRRAAGCPHRRETTQVLIEQDAHRMCVSQRRHAADHVTRHRAHEIWIRTGERLLQQCCDLAFADAAIAAGDHHDRLTARRSAKHDRLRDLADRAADRRGGIGAGTRRLLELDDARIHSSLTQELNDAHGDGMAGGLHVGGEDRNDAEYRSSGARCRQRCVMRIVCHNRRRT